MGGVLLFISRSMIRKGGGWVGVGGLVGFLHFPRSFFYLFVFVGRLAYVHTIPRN